MSRFFNRFTKKFGSNRDDTLDGSDRSDFMLGFGGDDEMNGGGGNDVMFGGRGNDEMDGGTGKDVMFGGKGNDVMRGGSGSDWLFGGKGNDVMIYDVSQNGGARDYYNGGRGNDTLQLELTTDMWLDPAFQADLVAFLDQSQSGHHHGCAIRSFNFESLGLRIKSIENLDITVDGQSVTAQDDGVVTVDDIATIDEDTAQIAGNVLINDTVPDLVASIAVTQQTTYGTVTIGADGAYLFALDTARAEVQALNDGETMLDTFTYTVTDADGDQSTATVTITITGSNDNTAPALTFATGEQPDLAVGNLAASFSADISGWFADADGDTLTFTAEGLPAGLSLSADGILTYAGTPDLIALGGQDITLIADDGAGGVTRETMTLSVALQNNFGDRFGGDTGDETVTGSTLADTATFGEFVGGFGGSVSVDLGSGADTISFTGGAGILGGSVSVDSGDGTDTITFGNATAVNGGTVSVAAGNDADAITFGNSAGYNSGSVSVNAGRGADAITFGDYAAYGTGNSAAATAGSVSVNSGGGADAITFGLDAGGYGGSVSVDSGADADTITFGVNAGLSNGSVSVVSGSGADAITFGDNAGKRNGSVSVDSGDGADAITFGDNAGQLDGSINVDLGADTDTDTLTFEGSVYNTTITNWVQGDDLIRFTNPGTSVWTATDLGGDKVFTNNNGQNFTVVGAAGIAGQDIAGDLNSNNAPTFVGSTTALANGGVGSTGAAYSQDLSALFGDLDAGDTVSLSIADLPAGFTLTNGMLSAANDISLVGDYTFAVTATDDLGASFSQDLTLSVALQNNYGNNIGSGIIQTVTGSSVADEIIFGDLAGFRNGNVSVDSGDGADAITFGSDAGNRGNVNVGSGSGADTITFGDGAGDSGNISIDLGIDMDADTLIFLGTVENTTIANWEFGVDFAVDVVNEAAWSMNDNGTDTTLSNGSNQITFLDVTGITAVDDFLM